MANQSWRMGGRWRPPTSIWCTGYRHEFSWIDMTVFDRRGGPRHARGVAIGQPGLYFVGLPFLYGLTSALIGGVGRDAERIISQIAVALGPEPRAAGSSVLA